MSSLGACFLWASLGMVLLLVGFILFAPLILEWINLKDPKYEQAYGDIAVALVKLVVAFAIIGGALRSRFWKINRRR
jgi:uncharacterized membrane protein YjfL (UPF0719 family)